MNKVIKALGVSFIVVLARFLPLSIIIGSSHAMFSWSTILAPVVGVQCGVVWVFGFLVCKKLWIAPSLIMLLHRVPLLCAARAFQKREFLVAALLPAVCMTLFMVHPVGAQAWPYALYWLIPMVLCFVPDVVWARALQASFVAHAVGSVVWLYFGSIPAEIWMSLIPIVACERLLMAGGMVICNEFCNVIVRFVLFLRNRYCFARRIIE